jgi:hypothetical protein
MAAAGRPANIERDNAFTDALHHLNKARRACGNGQDFEPSGVQDDGLSRMLTLKLFCDY